MLLHRPWLRQAACAGLVVSIGALGVLGQRASIELDSSRRRAAIQLQTPPGACARGAGAFGGVASR